MGLSLKGRGDFGDDIIGHHHIGACGIKLACLKADHKSACCACLGDVDAAVVVDPIDKVLVECVKVCGALGRVTEREEREHRVGDDSKSGAARKRSQSSSDHFT